MASSKDIVTGRSRDQYSVLLPCSQEEFGGFVSSLLGKPQTISRYCDGVFEIEKQDLINMFHLVDQRVHQQNEGTLVQFVITTNYDDHSSVTLSSLQDFLDYGEIAPHVSTGVNLS